MVGCDSHTRWLGRILTDAILLNGVGDCDGYVRRKAGAHINGDKCGIIYLYGNAMKFATITCDVVGHLSKNGNAIYIYLLRN